ASAGQTIQGEIEQAPAGASGGPGVTDQDRPITGQIVAIGREAINPVTGPAMTTPPVAVTTDGSPDKLQMTIEALKNNPHITDEELAEYLALKRPASARFWRLKAIEILNAPGRGSTGPTPVVTAHDMWTTSGGLSNGKR
ncbi:MAG TPA: hypothetical protein VIZ18_16740, partial [Ktedonobacteraceae bacterium]